MTCEEDSYVLAKVRCLQSGTHGFSVSFNTACGYKYIQARQLKLLEIKYIDKEI